MKTHTIISTLLLLLWLLLQPEFFKSWTSLIIKKNIPHQLSQIAVDKSALQDGGLS